MILAVIGAIALITTRSARPVQATATAKAGATAAAETVVVATATAKVEATATATTYTPSATAVDTATAQGIVFQDDFSSNTKGWPVGEYSDDYNKGIVQIINGKYQRSLTSKQPSLGRTWIPYFSAKNFLLKVEATIVETSYAGDYRVAVTFRENNNNDFYAVLFASSKSYTVYLWQDNKLTTLKDWTFSPAVKVGPGVPNIFEILVEDSSFTLYANDQKLTTVTDSTLSAAGKIGLGLDLPEAEQTVTIDFDNLIIRKVP